MEKNTISFRLLGSFAYRSAGSDIWMQFGGNTSGGRKLRSFLEYLIVNHSRDISAEELIEKFWSGSDSKNPAGSLKYTMHKARVLLCGMFPEYDDLIWNVRGYYIWNPEVKINLDIEMFEQACICVTKQEKKNPDAFIKAIELYTGDLLPGSDADWVKQLRLYYRSLYIDICKTAILMLQDRGDWQEIARLSERSYAIEPGVEDFTDFLMQALISLGQAQRALEQYDVYCECIWEEGRNIPSDKIEETRSLALMSLTDELVDDRRIFEMVTQQDNKQNAFLCSFAVFKGIVNLEMRHINREKYESCIMIIGIRKNSDSRHQAADVRRAEKMLLENLRRGDPVARLNAGSFITLLSGVCETNASLISRRIDNAFHRRYRSSKAELDFRTFMLRPEVPEE